MAPNKIRSTDVELHEPEVTKPSPLRIIKRSQTITGSSSSSETFWGRQSSSSTISRGSPPTGADRPLTVRKKRQGRGSVMNFGSEEKFWDKENEQPLSALSMDRSLDDPDITPKAQARQGVSRTISAGNFLKNEFHRRPLEADQGRYSVRSNRHSFHPAPHYNSHIPIPSPARLPKGRPPKVPERRVSKSKNFILRALGGRSSEDLKPIQQVASKASKNTLIRRISRSSTMAPNHSASNSLSGDTIFSIPLDDLDIADVNLNAPLRAASPVRAPTQNVLVLSPRIKVTPELNSVSTTTCCFWVAIEVTGELHAADGHNHAHPSRRRCSSESAELQLQDMRRYGQLYAMGIDLAPGQGCCLLDVIGDLNIRWLNAGETQLILAKIRLDGVNAIPSPATRDPEILMADLQNHLGDTLTHYITVLATYRHSGFTRWESNLASEDGTYLHSTFIQTEARVAIKRHDPQSAWSPRASQTITDSPHANPLTEIIERHFSADRTVQALSIINSNRIPVASTNPRFTALAQMQGDEPVRPVQTEISARIDAAVMIPPNQTRPAARKTPRAFDSLFRGPGYPEDHIPPPACPPAPVHVRQTSVDNAEDNAGDDFEEDPARKIWASMREVSRGGRSHRHPRQSVSADHYYSVDDGCGPGRLSSAQSADRASRPESFTSNDSGIELERNMIKEVALRNKRSVGTETLRSIAPSVTKNAAKSKPGALGLGLRVGGWVPWW
ncbi:hypothetical protein BDZ45DRAFT_79157 [Acephala macrosclerotiorum]|nr:hypothetical protein BDZ45DRAFT_79157 [Acephala macrosclerotiorum]